TAADEMLPCLEFRRVRFRSYHDDRRCYGGRRRPPILGGRAEPRPPGWEFHRVQLADTRDDGETARVAQGARPDCGISGGTLGSTSEARRGGERCDCMGKWVR